MLLTGFATDRALPLESLEAAHAFLDGPPADSEHFVWIDSQFDEVVANPDSWRKTVQTLTGATILDLHLQDATNPAHPSYFDTTNVYDMVIFRKLTMQTTDQIVQAETEHAATAQAQRPRRSAGFVPALAKIDTQPVAFFVFDHVLVTVRPGQSRTLEQVRRRLLEFTPNGRVSSHTVVHGIRPPTRPEDLMLRLLNAMVDRYLELRAPLTRQLDRWQRALLNPRYGFSGWEGLLDARIQLRKLEHLCEEQRDALQEFRDTLLDNTYSRPNEAPSPHATDDALLVRINDVMEHVSRVLTHARRLEDSIESAVQIHFSAVAHRTSRTMRLLTLITALFMPLTLITGIFGMNFVRMPWIAEGDGFWWTMGLMAAVIVILSAVFGIARLSRD